jgi:hypothetical protein
MTAEQRKDLKTYVVFATLLTVAIISAFNRDLGISVTSLYLLVSYGDKGALDRFARIISNLRSLFGPPQPGNPVDGGPGNASHQPAQDVPREPPKHKPTERTRRGRSTDLPNGL